MCRYRMRRKTLRQRNMKKEMQNSLPDLIVAPEVPGRNPQRNGIPKKGSLKNGKQIPRRVRLR